MRNNKHPSNGAMLNQTPLHNPLTGENSAEFNVLESEFWNLHSEVESQTETKPVYGNYPKPKQLKLAHTREVLTWYLAESSPDTNWYLSEDNTRSVDQHLCSTAGFPSLSVKRTLIDQEDQGLVEVQYETTETKQRPSNVRLTDDGLEHAHEKELKSSPLFRMARLSVESYLRQDAFFVWNEVDNFFRKASSESHLTIKDMDNMPIKSLEIYIKRLRSIHERLLHLTDPSIGNSF